ncbi:MAG: hypothetical protein NVSMB18_12100 [Acetobacteraceae bacterium]
MLFQLRLSTVNGNFTFNGVRLGARRSGEREWSRSSERASQSAPAGRSAARGYVSQVDGDTRVWCQDAASGIRYAVERYVTPAGKAYYRILNIHGAAEGGRAA